MITAEDVQAWKKEAEEGPTQVVWEDIGESYKQRSVAMTFNYDRYMRLLNEVLRLHQDGKIQNNMITNFQYENDELRKRINETIALLRGYPGYRDRDAHEAWLEDVAIALGG
jgi:hypothetical protein